LPELREEVADVIEVLLTGGRIDDGLERNTEERQREEKDEYPKDGSKHGRYIIQQEEPGGGISA
jgi:hypothetical protein